MTFSPSSARLAASTDWAEGVWYILPLPTGSNWTASFRSKMTPSTVSGNWLLFTRFKITLPTAICPVMDSPPLSA